MYSWKKIIFTSLQSDLLQDVLARKSKKRTVPSSPQLRNVDASLGTTITWKYIEFHHSCIIEIYWTPCKKKNDKMLGSQAFYQLFCNEFDKFNNTGTQC